jgi:hypothetical protein
MVSHAWNHFRDQTVYRNAGQQICEVFRRPVHQGCRNPVRQVAQATKFCTVAPDICGSSEPNLFHFILLTPRILMWLPEFWKTSVPLRYTNNALGGVLGLTA